MRLICRKLCGFLCFRLALYHSVSYFFFIYRSPYLSLCTVFDSISSNTDEVLSINRSANVFVFGDFNAHYQDWLTYSGGTDRPGELCYNFSISNDLTHMVNFPTWIPDCDSHNLSLLDFFLPSDASICCTMEILIMLLFQFTLTFYQTDSGMFRFIAWLMIVLVLIGTVFVII